MEDAEKFSLETAEREKWGQGDGPLGLPPLWGREGVPLITFPK